MFLCLLLVRLLGEINKKNRRSEKLLWFRFFLCVGSDSEIKKLDFILVPKVNKMAIARTGVYVDDYLECKIHSLFF